MISEEELTARARRQAMTIEPFAGQVDFSPECHAQYVALGFASSAASGYLPSAPHELAAPAAATR